MDISNTIDELKRIEWFSCKGEPLPEWQLFTAGDWVAAGARARNGLSEAVDHRWHRRDRYINLATCVLTEAFLDSYPESDMQRVCERVHRAVYDAAIDAAKKANSDWNLSIHYPAPDPNKAAQLACTYTAFNVFMSDVQLEDRHRKIIADVFEVYRRGWALAGECNGVLYVYGVK